MPVSLRPSPSNSQFRMYHHQEPSQHSPAKRYPRIQHPADSGTHDPYAHPYTHDRVTAYRLSRCQYQSLSRRILRHVDWLMDNVKALKVSPHWMAWVG